MAQMLVLDKITAKQTRKARKYDDRKKCEKKSYRMHIFIYIYLYL